jgi:hypothetical protein
LKIREIRCKKKSRKGIREIESFVLSSIQFQAQRREGSVDALPARAQRPASGSVETWPASHNQSN